MPVGIHDCNLTEVEAAFVHNNQRELVWQGFNEYLELIKSNPGLNVVYIDGGFVTDKAHPKDVDIIIEYRDGKTRFQLKQTYWYLRLRGKILDKHLVDVLDCLLNEPSPNMRDFFQRLRPEEAIQRGLPAGSQKGILRISLR